jgi:hypothetical protein
VQQQDLRPAGRGAQGGLDRRQGLGQAPQLKQRRGVQVPQLRIGDAGA